jgi:two-component system, NarL family, nitrate/nitrite response regulator NarL
LRTGVKLQAAFEAARMNQAKHKAIRVGLADKNPLIQAALKQLLSEDLRFELLHVASDCVSFLDNIARQPVDEKHAPRVIVYTGDENQTVPIQVMTHGGAAFVSKSEQPAVLLDTIAAVASGRMVFPYIDVRTLYDNPLTTLTRRELEVLSDLASGRTNKQIARDLGVSLNTVKFHVRNLFQKLGVNSRGQAISMYLRS